VSRKPARDVACLELAVLVHGGCRRAYAERKSSRQGTGDVQQRNVDEVIWITRHTRHGSGGDTKQSPNGSGHSQ
jgi:hypothetical protein